jgi:biotin synthesis protein BioG
MERHWLRREGGSRLAIFVLGWAVDWRIVERAAPEGCDVLAVYDFRSVEPVTIGSYSECYLFAWSFGVRGAESLFGGEKFTRAVALNGTPRPVDDLYGSAPRRLEATLRGLAAGGMETFERRAYGEYYEALREHLSPRGLDAIFRNSVCYVIFRRNFTSRGSRGIRRS